jgi:hypothetical protein
MGRKQSTDASRKSQACFAGSLYTALFADIASGRPPCIASSLMKDLSTVHKRLDKEGISFCTITLPTLEKAILQSFRTGKLETPTGFSHARGTTLPKFLSGLLGAIYSEDGTLLPDADIASITEALQIAGLGYKLKLGYSSEQEEAVIKSFLDTEIDILALDRTVIANHPIVELSRSMVAEVFRRFSREKLRPRHGPGSVATGERVGKKWDFKRLYLKLHQAFPYYEYFVVSRKHLLDRIKWYKRLRREDLAIAKVVLVPKDSRGPRLISMEPLEHQFIQQAICREMYHLIEMHPFSGRHVNFSDQTMNRQLAIIGSFDGSWATLDMKEASDRVSTLLVEELFKDSPELLGCLLASRSDGTLLPDGRTVFLHKFAPMGSAVCFPVESIVHFVLAVSAIALVHNVSVRRARDSVYVYGDDLVVRQEYVEAVMKYFPLFGLKFNEKKCFIQGPFRESCGANEFKGVDVTTIRWREPWPAQRIDAASAQAFCDLASLFYQRGYLQVADMLWTRVERLVGKLPTTGTHLVVDSFFSERSLQSLNVGYLSRKSRFPYVHSPLHVRYNLSLQHLEHRALTSFIQRSEKRVDQWEGTFCSVLTGAVASQRESGRPVLKNRWMGLLG